MGSFGLTLALIVIGLSLGYAAVIKIFPKAAEHEIFEESGDILEEVLKDEVGINYDLNGDSHVGVHDSAVESVIASSVEGEISKLEEPSVK